jgi:hypothetical protein
MKKKDNDNWKDDRYVIIKENRAINYKFNKEKLKMLHQFEKHVPVCAL